MNLKTAQSLLRYYRPGNPGLQDPQMQKALRVIEASPEAKATLAMQIEFDDRQAEIIRSITPDEQFLTKIDDKVENLQKGFQWSVLMTPPFLAGALALLVVIGVLIYFGMAWMEDFPGRDTAEEMIDKTEEMTGIELEPKVTEAGMLEDWFALNDYKNFRMLPEFAHMKTVGCRVFQQEGYSVAQIALENHNSLFYIFHSDELGVKIDPPDQWKYFEQGPWAVAIRADADTCFMVAFQGKTAEMKDFISGLGK